MFQYYKTRLEQSAEVLTSKLESANKISVEIDLLTTKDANLSAEEMEDLKKASKVELETPLKILHQSGAIKKDEDYLSQERFGKCLCVW